MILLPQLPLEKKHYSHLCMRLKGQQSRLSLVSLETRQPGQVMCDRGQQIKECLWKKWIKIDCMLCFPAQKLRETTWNVQEQGSGKIKDSSSFCYRTPCKRILWVEKVCTGWQGTCTRNSKKPVFLGSQSVKNHTSGLWNIGNWECTWRKYISFLTLIFRCEPSCNHLDGGPNEPLEAEQMFLNSWFLCLSQVTYIGFLFMLCI